MKKGSAEIILKGESKRKRKEIYQRIKLLLGKYIWDDIYKEDLQRNEMDLCGIWTEKQEHTLFLHDGDEYRGEILLQIADLSQSVQKEYWLTYESKLKDLEEEVALCGELLQEYEKNQKKSYRYEKMLLQEKIHQKEKIITEFYKDIFEEEKVERLCKEICFTAEWFLENSKMVYKND